MPRLLSLFAALALLGAAPFQPAQKGTRTIYRHAALIDGTGAPLRPDVAVIVDGERILEIVPDERLTPAQVNGAKQVDLAGKYLLPGLIDTHQHFATPPDRPEAEARLKRDIYSGITATRDMADDLRQMSDITRQARVGEIASPDIYYAALMAGPSFFVDPRTQAVAQGAEAGAVPWMQSIDANTDMPLAVARAKGTYATAIKIYANLPGDLVAKITAEGHRQGMKVWAHGMVFPATPQQVVDAGVDTVSHTCYLGYQAMDRRPDSYQHRFPLDAELFNSDNPAMAALFADMAKRGTVLDATIHVYRAVEAAAKEQRKPPLCTVALAGKLTNRAYRAGVTISSGTDDDTPITEAWPALFDELELLRGAAGLAPMDVLKATTINAAKAAGQDKDMGTIEAGKLANFAILSKNPLDDVRNFRSVVLTVKRGGSFERSDYRP